MAAFNKFETFVGDLGLGVHNLNTDTFKVFLTNGAPSASLDSVKADLTEIAAGNGYTLGGEDILNIYSEALGTGTMGATDVTWLAAGGTIGPFRYAVLYNDTSPSKSLVAWYEYPGGASITLNDTETFTVDWTDVFDLT